MGYMDEDLWKILEIKAREEDNNFLINQKIADEFLSSVKKICQYGVERSITIRDTFPMYTLHNEVHICNVMRLMIALLGDDVKKLSRDEAAMLILVACCHDIGMSYSLEEKEELLNDSDRLNQYLDNHYSEYIKAYASDSSKPNMTEEMIQDYLRDIHHERVMDLLCSVDWPFVLEGRVDCRDVIRICQSHGKNISFLNELESSSTVDLRFCAVLLRIADILDFDTSRAPQAVYEYSGFTSKENTIRKSKEEWEKHLASQGFDFIHAIDRTYPYDLEYYAVSRTMQIEQTINCYLDWVDSELNECAKQIKRFVGKWQNFILPGKIKRNIRTEGYVSGQYKMTMDQNRILELLAGKELYNDPTVFVRELIQNAIDAVRTREQLDRNRPIDWKPQINIRCWIDEEGYHWFRIEDNGIGMTEDIIKNYLLKAGCSYYTSDEFRQAKIRCRANIDYMPISRFGIGILSCFVGNDDSVQIEISTKHFNENSIYYPALRMSIHGMNGYYYMASKAEKHIPGPMKGVTSYEKKPYLEQAGTVIAVRINLYKVGKYRGFKEIVDHYVVYPIIPIHYDGMEGSFDYATEMEFMDVIHNVSKQGDLEFKLSEDQLCEIYRELPELSIVEEPKIILKCIPLDQYTESPYLSGGMICTKTEGKCEPIVFQIGKKKIIAEVCIKADSENGALNLTFLLEFPKDFSRSMESIEKNSKLHYKEMDEILQPTIVNEDIIDTYHEYQIINKEWRFRICKLDELSWYKTYIRDILLKTSENGIIVHNGIFCSSSLHVGYKSNYRMGEIILLKDKYRPKMNVARDYIYQLPLELSADLAIVENKLSMMGFNSSDYSALSLNRVDLSTTTKDYCNLLDNRADIKNNLYISTDKGLYTLETVYSKIQECDKLEFKNFPGFTTNVIYDYLCASGLCRDFSLNATFGKDENKVFIMKQKEIFIQDYADNFPPFLFVHTLNDCLYLTVDYIDTIGDSFIPHNLPMRHICNINHRLSLFILKNERRIKKYAPGILQEILYYLVEANKASLIKNVNELLFRLKEIPGNFFEIPDELFLTDEDIPQIVCSIMPETDGHRYRHYL